MRIIDEHTLQSVKHKQRWTPKKGANLIRQLAMGTAMTIHGISDL